MFDWMLPKNHAIAILKKDHDEVKRLFTRFEKERSAARRETIIARAVEALKIHAVLEEEIFYPTVRQHVGAEIMNEADEEHHVAKVLIAELDTNGPDHDHRHAKFTVLAESIRHHIKEEENEMLPKAREVEVDFEALGRQMLERKHALEAAGCPPDAEHQMVAGASGLTDSPAAAAHRTRRTARPRRKAARRATGRRHRRPDRPSKS